MLISSYIKEIVINKLRDRPLGKYSACSSNPFILKASMKRAKSSSFPLSLITLTETAAFF